MPYDSTAVIAPQTSTTDTLPTAAAVTPEPKAFSADQINAIQNAVFDANHSPDNIRLSLPMLLAITIVGFLVTVMLVVALNLNLR